MTMQDITPEGSVAPVFLSATEESPVSEGVDLDALLAAQDSARQSALMKLMALGLTEEEALALAGG